MSFENVTKVDVLYDKKAYGNLIDPYEWNNNFEVIENVANSNAEKINKNFNSLIDGSNPLPIPDYFGGGGAPSTINAQLELIVNRLKDTYTISEIDAADASMKQNTVKSIMFDEDTGVFTITTADGRESFIDTNIEKIPVSVSLLNEGNNVYLVLTLDDGTSTRADVTALLNVYTFNDSETIGFTNNNSNVSANIKDGSITPAKLSSEVLASINALSDSASASAQSASASATNAKQSSDSASSSATIATTAATNANAYANSANDSKVAAENVKKSVDTTAQTILAKVDTTIDCANQASNSATIASQKATEAQAAVDSIGNSVTVATTKASEAEVSANEALASATEAANQVVLAKTEVSKAAEQVNLASVEVTKASEQVNLAKAEVIKAAEQSGISEDFSLTSKSYAVGGTGTRTGEDTDNAKYYAEQAKQAAGGDFVTNADFNAHTSNQNNPHNVTCESIGALPSTTPIHNSPAGGTIGQVLMKISDDDYDTDWGDASGGVGKFYTDWFGEIFNDYTDNCASGDFSHSEGMNTTASGQASHAEGQFTTASGDNSHAEGGNLDENYNALPDATLSVDNVDITIKGSTAHGASSHAEGTQTLAYGYSSHSEGRGTIACGQCSHAEGNNTQANGISSHAEGNETNSSGDNSHAEGLWTTSSGHSSHAEGNGTSASEESAHAEGLGTVASGAWSHAEGENTQATGTSSHAEGCATAATGACSHAEGLGTSAVQQAQHVCGKYNVEDYDNLYALIIGNGYDIDNRFNAFAIRWDGSFDTHSPNGALWNISVDDSGALVATQV